MTARSSQKFKKLFGTLTFQNSVVLLGHIPNEKVLQEEADAKIFVHPSHYESNSNAVSEVMTLGLPIIVPRLPWAIEQTEGYINKSFFSIGDLDDLADKIKKMITIMPARQPWKGSLDDERLVEVVQRLVERY